MATNNDKMSHAQIREVHLRHKEDWGRSRPCPCQYCDDDGIVRHTCRYEPPEKRVLPCQGCETEARSGIPSIPMFSDPGAAVQKIHDLVREGRITPAQGADLLQLREELRRARRPWWRKALGFIWDVIWA